MDEFLDKHIKSREAKLITKAYLLGGSVAVVVALIYIVVKIIEFFST